MSDVAFAPAAVSLHDPVGETFDRYCIVRLIAKGGMGRVYEADDVELGRRVAVKFLPAVFAQRADRVARFARERMVTADLEHPAIIPVYDSGIWPSGEPFFVMRHVRGESLARRLAEAKELDQRLLLLGHVVAAADAVAFAHSRGVVHRDLKPANVLVGSFGETFVADWGIAKRLDEGDVPAHEIDVGYGEPNTTRDGSILGTPAYMAPEQREGRPVDRRADVYALGAILRDILVGPPLRSQKNPEPPESPPAALADLAAIVAKAMAPDPDDRYESASYLAVELHRLQAGQLVSARRYSRLELAGRWMARHRAVVAVAVTMTGLMVVIVVVSLARVVRERDRARTERANAEAVSRRLAERNEALVITQARAELAHDPTASLAGVKRHPAGAGHWGEAAEISADAISRGVSSRVWDLGVPLAAVDFSPDGRTLAIGTTDRALVLVDVATGARRSLRAEQGLGARVAFSPDGALVATSDEREGVLLWDVSTGTSRRLPGEHVGGTHLAFSPDGAMLLVHHPGGFDHVWRVGPDEALALEQEALVGFAAPGTVFLARGGRLEHVEAASGRVLESTRIDGAPFLLQGSSDGRWAAVVVDKAIVLWNPESGALRRTPTAHRVRAIAASPDGRRFVTCGIVGDDLMFDVGDERPTLFSRDEQCSPRSLAFSPDGRGVLSMSYGGELRLHVEDVVRPLLGHRGAIADAAFSPDGRWIASVSADGTARLWSLDRGDVLGDRTILPLERIALGERMLVTAADGSAELYDLKTGARRTLSGPRPRKWCTQGSLSTNGRVAAFPDADGSLVVWDLAKDEHRTLGRFEDAGAPEVADVLSPDGAMLAQTDERAQVRLVDTATGQVRSLGQLDDLAFGLAFSTDARRLAVGARDGSVRVWDVANGTSRVVLRVPYTAWDVAISADGARIAVASDGGVHVVDLASGETRRLVGHAGTVGSVDFLPGGGRLLSSGADGTVRLWDIPTGDGVIVRREPKIVRVRASADGSLVTLWLEKGLSVWRTAILPPPPSDLPAFQAWAFSQSDVEVDDATGRAVSVAGR
jgi:WD40 repeat protein